MKRDAATQIGDNTTVDADNCTLINRPKKIELTIFSLLQAGSEGITQPEAYRQYGESCLHTSISSLRKKGVGILSSPDLGSIKYQGQKPFSRYRIESDNSRKLLLNLLNHYRKKRGEAVLCFTPDHEAIKKSA